ncbi:unnamed protein product [Schistosoma turkestanicum]|nr:unnamed protein product [Schistosoma turkestanicum]
MENGSPKLCICQICTCGRHKCPHQRPGTQITKPCGISEYTTQFIAHPIAPVKSCKPPHKGVQGEGHMASATTHRIDYIPHPLSMQTSCRKESPYKPPQAIFDGLTTYAKEYTGQPGQMAVAIKPAVRTGPSAKFEGEATYTADYRPWKLERHEVGFGRESGYPLPTGKFASKSTTREDYVPHLNYRPPESCKPLNQRTDNLAPFDGATLYSTEFTPKYVEPCPASLLNTSRSKYVYTSTSDKGHQIYRRLSSNASIPTNGQQHPMTMQNEPLTVAH